MPAQHPESDATESDKDLIDRAMKALDKLADAITIFQCCSELAERGNQEAAKLAQRGRVELLELIGPP